MSGFTESCVICSLMITMTFIVSAFMTMIILEAIDNFKPKTKKSTLSDEDKMMLNELIIGFYGYRDQYPNFWKLRTDDIIEWLKKKKDERTTDNGRTFQG